MENVTVDSEVIQYRFHLQCILSWIFFQCIGQNDFLQGESTLEEQTLDGTFQRIPIQQTLTSVKPINP